MFSDAFNAQSTCLIICGRVRPSSRRLARPRASSRTHTDRVPRRPRRAPAHAHLNHNANRKHRRGATHTIPTVVLAGHPLRALSQRTGVRFARAKSAKPTQHAHAGVRLTPPAHQTHTVLHTTRPFRYPCASHVAPSHAGCNQPTRISRQASRLSLTDSLVVSCPESLAHGHQARSTRSFAHTHARKCRFSSPWEAFPKPPATSGPRAHAHPGSPSPLRAPSHVVIKSLLGTPAGRSARCARPAHRRRRRPRPAAAAAHPVASRPRPPRSRARPP